MVNICFYQSMNNGKLYNMKTTNGNRPLKAAQGHWNKESIKREDMQRRKARKDARGKQWLLASVL